jgi:glycosyltransferase involved in cell wall biosynthesis
MADAVTVEAEANRPPERMDAVVIPPGIDTARFSPDGATPVSGRIVAVGSLLRRKGFDTLIRAVAIAMSDGLQPELVIAGTGPQLEALENLALELGIRNHVYFAGHVDRGDLPALYRSAVVACHPARQDSFPLAPIEAMACGVPVIVSEAGALPEMVGKGGLTHPTQDPQALAGQLVRILTNTSLRTELATAARGRAVTRYSLDAMCQGYINLYLNLAQGRKGGSSSAP